MASPGSSHHDNDDRLGVPSPNPIPLSNSQEAQVREVYYTRVRKHCADEIRAFAECAAGRTFSVAWACKAPQRAMNGCIKAHATQAEQDAARDEWFATRSQRQRKNERRYHRKTLQEDFLREWWGLPDADPERRQREQEKLHRAERVGGFPPGRTSAEGGAGPTAANVASADGVGGNEAGAGKGEKP